MSLAARNRRLSIYVKCSWNYLYFFCLYFSGPIEQTFWWWKICWLCNLTRCLVMSRSSQDWRCSWWFRRVHHHKHLRGSLTLVAEFLCRIRDLASEICCWVGSMIRFVLSVSDISFNHDRVWKGSECFLAIVCCAIIWTVGLLSSSNWIARCWIKWCRRSESDDDTKLRS